MAVGEADVKRILAAVIIFHRCRKYRFLSWYDLAETNKYRSTDCCDCELWPTHNFTFHREVLGPCFLPTSEASVCIRKRLLWVWMFRGIGLSCTGNVRRKFTCNIFSFSHAKLFPGAEHSGCLFIPFCCLLLALHCVASLSTNRPEIEGVGVTTTHTLLCLWIKTSSFNSTVNLG